MIIIAEKINATRKSIAQAIESHDAAAIAKIAREQADAGAHYIDVNGGDPRPGREAENIAWLVEVVQDAVELPLCIDSPDPDAMRAGLEKARAKPIVNSVTLEADRLETFGPLIEKHECMVIALLMSDAGPPSGVDDRVKTATALIEKITAAGKKLDEIIVDPCFFPIAANTEAVKAVVEAIAEIRNAFGDVHIGGGVSNASHGLPQRKYVNLAAIVQGIFAGMDCAIVDPCLEGTIAQIYAAEAISGRDEFCMNYVTAAREGKLR